MVILWAPASISSTICPWTLISVFGALLYLGGFLTVGHISSFVLYSRKFSGPINEFANIIGELQSSLAAAERIFLLLDERAETADEALGVEVLDCRKGEVDFEQITFGYEPGRAGDPGPVP